MGISWRSKRSLLLKNVLKTANAGRLLRNRLTELGGRLTELGGRHADLLKDYILKMLHLKQTLNLGDLGKETLTSEMALLPINRAVGDHSLQFQQSKQTWEIGEKELRLTVWRWK